MSKRNLGHFNPEMREFVDADYLDSLSEEEYQWYKKFSKEYYDNKFTDEPIHGNVEELKKENNKSEYRAREDVFNRSRRRGELDYLNERPYAITADVSIEDMNYEEVYKRSGYAAALEHITTTCLNQLDEKVVDAEIVLERFYLQRKQLMRLEHKDKEAQKTLRERRYGK